MLYRMVQALKYVKDSIQIVKTSYNNSLTFGHAIQVLTAIQASQTQLLYNMHVLELKINNNNLQINKAEHGQFSPALLSPDIFYQILQVVTSQLPVGFSFLEPILRKKLPILYKTSWHRMKG